MVKWLTVFCLLTFATVGLLASKSAPLGTPKYGVAKPDGSQNGSPENDAQHNQQSSIKPASVAPEPPAPSCDETCQQGRQNIAIQGKLECFTGVLAAVGILQLLTIAWQGYLLRQTREDVHRQAGLMENQLHEMQTAGVRETSQLALIESELRAYLSAGIPNTAGNLETRVPIENYGKTTARIIGVTREHVQLGWDKKEVFRETKKTDNSTASVPPGKAGDYAIFITTRPFTKEIAASTIGIVVEYDAGFGRVDTLAAAFSQDREGNWVQGNKFA